MKLKDKHIEVQTKHAEIEKLKNDLDLQAQSMRAEVERLQRSLQNSQTQVQAKHEELERAKSKLANFESLQETQKGAFESIQTMEQAMMECKADIVELQQRLQLEQAENQLRASKQAVDPSGKEVYEV